MPRPRDFEAAVERAEKELRRCCAKLADRFEPGLLRGRHLDLRIEGLKPRTSRLEEMGPPVVRIPAPALAASKQEILAALLHAMIHWVNAQRGIADCNHAGYHNRHFRDLAQAAGFAVGDRQPNSGWSDLSPTADLAATLASLPLRADPLHRLLAALPADFPTTRRRCKPNLPTGEAASPYWRTAEALLPKLPRYRLEHHRQPPHPDETHPKIRTPADADALFWQILHRFDREALAVLFLDTRHRVIGYDIPYIGTLTRANVEPRGILAPALLLSAAAVAIAHNHPSGDATPSREDELFTRRVAEAGAVLGVELVGSIVVGGRGAWRRVRS